MLAYLTADLAPIPVRLRNRLEHFVVEEIPAYEPSGQGEHVYLHIEKRGLTTPEAARRIATAVGADPGSAGYAGFKDRHAITRQWISLVGGPEVEQKARGLDLGEVRVIEVGRHVNRIRRGHLHGNRFRLVLAETADVAGVAAVLDRLGERGMPNYFGEQRFGRGGDNVERALGWLHTGRGPRDRAERNLLASSLQADLFNRCLDGRLRSGEFGRIVAGDLVQRLPVGAQFVATEPAALDLEVDLAGRAITATGPLYGPRMRWPEGEPLATEQRILAAASLTADDFRRFGRLARGGRRPYWVWPADVSCGAHPEGVEICFTLPAGAYATCLVREIAKS